MTSKSKIEKKLRKKTSSKLVETIIKAKKQKGWLKIAEILASSTKNMAEVNLDKIDKESKEGDTIIVPGKVLSKGEVNKKIRISALFFSQTAEEKLRKKNCEVVSILEEIKENPKGEGIKIIK